MLDTISARTVLLSGAGTGEAARGLLPALASVGGRPCVVAAHNAASGLLTGPGDLRAARRGMRLAAELHIPLLTIVDTAGAELSAAAEEGGLAAEIARCLADLMSIHSPTLSVLLGQGGGGSALALLPADRTVAARSSWLAPLPPEGGSALVYRDLAHAADIANGQHVTSADLLAAGAVDRVVTELPDDPASSLRRLGDVVTSELAALARMDPVARLTRRRSRYANLGAQEPTDLGAVR